LLESIEHFLNRLDIYTKIPPTVAMTEMIVKILAELLSALALATKQIKQGKPSESVFGEVLYYLTQFNAEKHVKKLLEEKGVDAVLQTLDRLTQDDARITAAQTLEVVYGLIQNMRVVLGGEQIH
jgi:ERCC4-related helicase